MKNRNHRSWRGLTAVLVVLLVLVSTVPGLAQTGPNTMNFQGRLLDSSGDPRDGKTHCMRFRLCSDSSCTFQVWPFSGYETQAVTTESGTYKGGLFNVTLGTTHAIAPELMYDNDTLYLEIGVADEAACPGSTWSTMTPRSQIQTNAYAQRSRRVRTVEADDTYLVHVENTGQGGGIYGETASTGDVSAAHFVASGASGWTSGLNAENYSTTNGAAAARFNAYGLGGVTTGVYARNISTTDYATAGKFEATGSGGQTYGIWSRNTSVTDEAAAGLFVAEGTSGQTWGIRASNMSTSDGAAAGQFNAWGDGATIGIQARNFSSTDNAKAGFFHASGTSGNTYGLVVQNDSTTDQARAGHFWANGNNGQTYGLVSLNDSSDSASVAGYFRATGGVGVYARSDLKNSIEAYSSATERRFYVDNTGNVWADGAFVTPSADFAEMWLADEEGMAPGDVLVVDSEGRLVQSSAAYDITVVGVYSTQPAIIGGSDEAMENPGKVPLAVVGIVPVKASAERVSIQPGDLLVTSDVAGHVMKADDDPPIGTVVGKALERLESGTGVIQMLVTLQ